MIFKFSCKNFRNVDVSNLNLERINLLIGPNNSGKSNFIRALTFFANMIAFGEDPALKTSLLAEVKRNNWVKPINRHAEPGPVVSFEWASA